MRFSINIEFLIFIIIILLLVIWVVWKKLSIKRALKKYKPENDKGRLAEEKRRRNKQSAEAALGSPGLAEPPERISIPPTADDSFGTTSDSIGKTGRESRNPFRRKRRK